MGRDANFEWVLEFERDLLAIQASVIAQFDRLFHVCYSLRLLTTLYYSRSRRNLYRGVLPREMEEELDLEGTVVGEIGAVRGVSLLIDTEQRS